jgi:fluoride exporter
VTEATELPVDSDVDVHVPMQRDELRRAPWAVLSVIALGGTLGALARYGLSLAFPTAPGGFPLATFGINVTGSLLIGALAVFVSRHNLPLLRPFVGVGILGGYTTFSTYVVDIQRLIDAHAFLTASAYLGGTLVAAVLAAEAGLRGTTALTALTDRTVRS